jgi:hypothetical protein
VRLGIAGKASERALVAFLVMDQLRRIADAAQFAQLGDAVGVFVDAQIGFGIKDQPLRIVDLSRAHKGPA